MEIDEFRKSCLEAAPEQCRKRGCLLGVIDTVFFPLVEEGKLSDEDVPAEIVEATKDCLRVDEARRLRDMQRGALEVQDCRINLVRGSH